MRYSSDLEFKREQYNNNLYIIFTRSYSLIVRAIKCAVNSRIMILFHLIVLISLAKLVPRILINLESVETTA